jgi:hypothetical protein
LNRVVVAAGDIPLHPLNKLPYGKLDSVRIGVTEGVVFLTYTSLVSSSDRGISRFKQLVDWCGKGFDGLIIFDESEFLFPFFLRSLFLIR